jgi:hypothetical protein
MISVDVRTMLRRERTMTQATEQTSDELIAELNADLRARDPMRAMTQQIRLRTLDQVRQRVSQQRGADDTHADIYRQVEAIITDLEHPPLA